MNLEEFQAEFIGVLSKYNACCEENCDAWPLVTGHVFYKHEDDNEPFIGVNGFAYNRDGGIQCNFSEYINDIKKSFLEEYGY